MASKKPDLRGQIQRELAPGAARQTRASTRRSRRAVSIRSLIVTRPSCQPRSGNWTL
jgi:hypothetical protein